MVNEIAGILDADGLEGGQGDTIADLLGVWGDVLSKNAEKRAYFDGDVPVREIGVSSIPKNVKVDVSCDWAHKAVMSVANRSRFRGFVFENGESDETMERIERANAIANAYSRFVASELIHGCMSATVGGTKGAPEVRFHSAESSVMLWDTANNRIAAGLAITDTELERKTHRPRPTKVSLYIPGVTVEIAREGATRWVAEQRRNPLDRPMMEAFRHAPTGMQPMGTSRITRPLRDAIDAALRILVDVQVATETNAAPQKYALGLSTEQFMALAKDTRAAYAGAMMLATTDENGGHPDFGQLPGANLGNFSDVLSMWARQVSSTTGVPLSELGVVAENQYYESRESLIMAAEDLNDYSREALQNVALMAMAVDADTTIDKLDASKRGVMADFKNPARPSVTAMADAMTKIGAQDAGIVGTPFYYGEFGYSSSQISRIQSEKSKAATNAALDALIAAQAGATPQEVQAPERAEDGAENAPEEAVEG